MDAHSRPYEPPLDPPAGAASPLLPSASVRLDELGLDGVLHLLQRAGRELPPAPAATAAGELPDATDWLKNVIGALSELSIRDTLTGLANRRQFELAIAREVDRVARTGEPALLLLLDIDHFKRVNDTHGHAAGDVVIRTVAHVLQDCVRPMDTVARVGGEEYAIILPNCQPAFGQVVAERIRHRVAARPIAITPHLDLEVTVSVGGAFAPQWVRSSATLWMERADRQLYRAKTEGRNRTCMELPPLPSVSAEEKSLLFAFAPTLPADLDGPR